ncbi:transposase [Pseudomonas sp. Z4-20]|uniref:transposase n=1 Tax=Pseudomonas sp. Z4-20 TaxID=2817414 RepID=UPI003DA971BE
MTKDSGTSITIHTSRPVRAKVPPLRIPRPWKPANPTVMREAVPYQSLNVSDAELRLARKRDTIFQQLKQNMIDQPKAMELLELKKSQFYKLYNKFLASESYLELARKKRGTKPGRETLTEGQRAALEMAYQEYYRGPSASSAKVWKESQGLCPDNERTPSKYQARRFVAAKPEKEKYYRKHSKEKGDNKYLIKSGKKVMERVLQQVQMDHTSVDILLVDEFDSSVIVGRPWLTILMCSLTRVILGLYLSLQAPGLRTVANALSFAILDKTKSLELYAPGINSYPFHGIPFQIYTDNAAEFTSPRFIATCKRWGMDWDHRPVDKKWYGGLIERVIGTFMTSVHFLPGTTGSNVIQRQGLTPEHDAKYNVIECAKFLLDEAILYNGTVRQALGCTPRQAWDHYDSLGLLDRDRVIRPEDHDRFLIDFLSPSYGHVIHPYGINFAGRRYGRYELEPYIGYRDVEIRYQPYDLGSIWVLIEGQFMHVACSFTRDRLSNNWESYSNHRGLSRARLVGHNVPSGMLDDEYALEAQERQRLLAQQVKAKPKQALPLPDDAGAKDVTAQGERLPNPPAPQPVIGTPRVITNSGGVANTFEPKIIVDRFKL